MKKSNLITILIFIVFIAALIIFMLFREMPSASYSEENWKESAAAPETKQDEVVSGGPVSEEIIVPEEKKNDEKPEGPGETTVSEENILFIGDSRTVGLMEYGCIDGADFFANVGMSLYNIHKKTISVPGAGKVTLTELLDNKQFGRIYIMLGINELGYNFEKTTSRYKELIAFIRERQPGAHLFLQANLHVAKSRSDSDKVINNGAIDKMNKAISELADNKGIFYLDANVLFDDKNGNLDAEKNEDEVHLYAKYYAEWGDWIIRQTVLLTGED